MSFSGWNTDLAKRTAKSPASVFVEDVNEPRWAVKGPAGFFVFECGAALGRQWVQHDELAVDRVGDAR